MEENKEMKDIVEETSVDFGSEEAPVTEEISETEKSEQTEETSCENAQKDAPDFIRTGLTAVIVLAVFAVSYFVVSMFNQSAPNKPQPSPTPRPETALIAGSAPKAEINVKYTQKEAMEIAEKVAKKQFGSDAMVVPASDETPVEVEIGGEMRLCYIFGADSMSKLSNGASMRGLYHLDANTGELFDNQNGEMKKVN